MISEMGQDNLEIHRVAVIGLGAYGLATVKNLLEKGGSEVVGYERNEYIGGTWKASPDPTQTTVLASTIANISKQRILPDDGLHQQNSFTDFPFPDDVPDHPTSAQTQIYLEAYAEAFNLSPHFRLGTSVTRIVRSREQNAWFVTSQRDGSAEIEEFYDKIVITTGPFHTPVMPKIKGAEGFKGEILHSQAFKRSEPYRGKSVMVVGLSNSGSDICGELSKVASKVYISHRSGARILPRRTAQGQPADHLATRRLVSQANTLSKINSSLLSWLMTSAIEKSMHESYPELKPEWKLLPAPPPTHSTPIVNDEIMPLLASGAVISVAGIAEIKDDSTVILTDGTTISDLDAVILCTGYQADFSILDPEIDPTNTPTPEYDEAPYGSSVRRYIRLYQGIFSHNYPDSLAFIGPFSILPAFTNADLISQAIAQIFTSSYPLPPSHQIQKWCDNHYKWSVKQACIARAPLGFIKNAEVQKWLNEVCGNEVNEKLGWGVEGWKFWLKERKLWDVIVNGVDTGFVYRLFEGKERRKRWEGAREAILKANGRL